MSEINMFDWVIIKDESGWNVKPGQKAIVVNSLSGGALALYIPDNKTHGHYERSIFDNGPHYVAARPSGLERVV